MANPIPPKIPTASKYDGPKDYAIKAGVTVVLVNEKKQVTMFKSATADIRVFTSWEVFTYADQATAEADIKAKGWAYTPTATLNATPAPAPAPTPPAK